MREGRSGSANLRADDSLTPSLDAKSPLEMRCSRIAE